MNRLQSEFACALQALAAQERFVGDARVIKFPAKASPVFTLPPPGSRKPLLG